MIHIHDLGGCAPTPLAHYLKALGILRLVAENSKHGDPAARAWWDGDRFRLATRLSPAELEEFFLDWYEPTPFVSPWNKGSGFFLPQDPGLTPIEEATAPRFARFREGITAGRSLLSELAQADTLVRRIKAETKDKSRSNAEKAALKESLGYRKRLAEADRHFKRLKAQLMPRMRRFWRGPHREWMDAAMVLGSDGTPHFPALLGTGGNDGRLDFTNNFMQRLGDVFDLASREGDARPLTSEWFRGALWGNPAANCLSGSAVGQYLPGMAGGANSANGTSGDSLLNPLDFLLMLEGSVLFTAHATRRLNAGTQSRAAAPFAINAQSAAYASAAATDESARGEQWMPLWSYPVTLIEFRRLLSEGRAQLGANAVAEPLDLARSVMRMGTARGISAFQRYGFIERNGQANLAVPLGRYRVPEHSFPIVACLDDLDGWLGRLRRESRATHAPARLRVVERQLSDTLFATAQDPEQSGRWQTVLLALGAVEAVLVSGSGYQAGPVPPLRPEWVSAATDGSAELRLALAFALQARAFRKDTHSPISPVRSHWLPLARGRFVTTGSGGQTRLQVGPEVVMHGRRGIDDAIALVQRRLVDASQRGDRCLPLVAAYRASAHRADLAALLAGEVDLDRTLALAPPLMALDMARWAECPSSPPRPNESRQPDDAWLAIRLALLPWPLKDGRHIGADPAIFRRLVAGDATTAVELALRRLRSAGISATVRAAAVPPDTARLWAAALAFPITRDTAAEFIRRLDPSTMFQERTP